MTAVQRGTAGRFLGLSADITGADSPEAAIDHAIETAAVAFESPVVVVWECSGEPPTPVSSSDRASEILGGDLWSPPDPLVGGLDDDWSPGEASAESWGPLQSELLVPAGDRLVLSLGSTEPDAFGDDERTAAEHIGTLLRVTLDRLEERADGPRATEPSGDGTRQDRSAVREGTAADVTALRDLLEKRVDGENLDRTLEALLSVGSASLCLETGLLVRTGGDEDTVEATADGTRAPETGTVLDREESLYEGALAGDTEEVFALADVGDSEHSAHPAAESTGAYIAAPVVVENDVYGAVEFSSTGRRERPFSASEREFVRLLAGRVGAAVETSRRLAELGRYETIIEAVGDPVYALDGAGRFTFLNQAAGREFGYGEEILGEHVSIGMAGADIERVREQLTELVETDAGSVTSEFDIETADGRVRTVENRIALSGQAVSDGTVGVLHDITEREQQRSQLRSFQQAIEDAVDGVAILDDEEYVYVDNSHVEMYGFDSKADLLGNTWRKLYSDDEIERLEQEAFPVLASEGYWQGRVTGTRPDGTTFPARLSLTRVDDGRLVCTVRDETERLAKQRDLALKERAMDEAGVGIHITDPRQDGNPLVYVNEQFEELTGYDRAEALGSDPWSLQQPDPETLATLREAIETGESARVELHDSRPDGESYYATLSMTPVRDEEGTLTHFIGVQRDITGRKQREQERAAAAAVFERVYRVTTDPALSFEEKVDGLLAAGREYLDLPNGFLTRIDRDDEASGTQTIVGAEASHELLQKGESCPLPRSYCRRTIGDEGLMTLVNAAETGWEGDPAHETFGLETYIGGEVAAGDELYGTLCFASREPREASFTETEQSFVRLLRRWASYEIERERTRAELGEQRERLELVLSGTETGTVEWNPQTDAVTWDDTLTEMVGRDPTSVEAFVECVHPEDRDRVQERMGQMLDTGEPWNGRFRVRTGDGEVMWLGTRATPIYEDSEPVRVLATGTDVTAEKRNEQKRRRNERRFQSLFEDPEMLVGLLDTEGTLLDANQTTLDYVDTSREEVIGDQFWETPWWAHSEELQADLQEWVERAADGEYVDFSAEHPGPDGDSREVTGTIRPVTDSSGSVESLVVSSRDVTERHRQERELRNRQQKLDLVLSNTDTSVAEVDLQSGEFIWNDSLGDNDIGSPETLEAFLEAVHPDDRERVQADIETMTGDIDSLDGEYRIENEAGEYRWIATQAVLVADDGAPGHIVAIATDVTELKERERSLAESRERFELLLESVDEYAFLTVDEDGAIDTWNRGAENLFGYDAETALGAPVERLHPDQESVVVDRLLQQARVAGESAHEGPRVRADGSTFYADVRFATLGSDDADLDGYAMIVRDMTDRRRQRRRTELFVEESDDVVSILDADGTIRYASGSADRVLGHRSAALVDENLFDYVHPNDREEALSAFYNSVDDGGETVRTGYRLESGGGDYLNVETGTRNMMDNDAIDGMLLYIRDVTERTERIRRLNAVFNGTFQFTGLLEPDGTVIEANESALEFGGFDREAVVGKRFFDIRWWTHSESVQTELKSALDAAADGEFVRYETEVHGENGLRTIDFSAKPVTDEDGDVAMLVVEGRDITAQEQSRQHLQVIHRVMRHNMRNDLHKVRAWSQLLVDEDDPETRAEQFARIERTLEKWERMTETLQEIRQALDGQRELDTDIAVTALVSETVSESQDTYPDATIDATLPENSTARVSSVLDRALAELIDNAVRASEAGEAHVEVRLSRLDGDWVAIDVADDGPGLPEMEADVLETGEETQLAHGGGLGLWMVRTLVAGNGGDIEVDSTAEGTSIRLLLPTA